MADQYLRAHGRGIKKIMNIVIIIVMVIWVLYSIFPGLWSMRVGPHP